jgi:chromosome segregation and condensation protein ScpB
MADVEVVEQMNLTCEMVSERQQTMLAMAAAGRQGVRVRALARATRRAQRAERQLARSRREAMRLGVELAVEQSS